MSGVSPYAPPACAPFLPKDWKTRSYLALDFETTGLDSRRDRVVEVGALRFSFDPAAPASSRGSPREEGALASLVNPGIPIPPEARAIHGITDEEVSSAPAFAALASALLALGTGSIIVAHNAPFDHSFLLEELRRAGQVPATNQVLDTRDLARLAFPGLRSYRLGTLAAAFGIDPGTSHRALDDARTCMGLFAACAIRLSSLPTD